MQYRNRVNTEIYTYCYKLQPANCNSLEQWQPMNKLHLMFNFLVIKTYKSPCYTGELNCDVADENQALFCLLCFAEKSSF